jgi:hypothetical protein
VRKQGWSKTRWHRSVFKTIWYFYVLCILMELTMQTFWAMYRVEPSPGTLPSQHYNNNLFKILIKIWCYFIQHFNNFIQRFELGEVLFFLSAGWRKHLLTTSYSYNLDLHWTPPRSSYYNRWLPDPDRALCSLSKHHCFSIMLAAIYVI